MKICHPLPMPFHSAPMKSVQTFNLSEKIGTQSIGICVTRFWNFDAFPKISSYMTFWWPHVIIVKGEEINVTDITYKEKVLDCAD